MINPQMLQMLSQLKSNPMSMLKQYGIPQDIANNPQAIIQHLMNTGQVSQSDYDRAIKIVQNFK